MGFLDFLSELNGMATNSDEARDKIERINAGSMASFIETAEKNGIDIFDPVENNGYIKNNNKMISDYLSMVNPSFNVKNFIRWAQNVFKEITVADSYAALPVEIKPYVDAKLDFSKVTVEDISDFSVSFLHLYKRIGDDEMLQVCTSVTDRDGVSDRQARRYFLRFMRKSQFKVVEMRRIKTTECPNCGGPVFFKRGDTSKCPYCGQFVTFEEYGWVLKEIEEVTPATVVENRGVM